jgi:hypothetical protein
MDGEPVSETDALDIHIALGQSHLFVQRYALLAAKLQAAATKLRQQHAHSARSRRVGHVQGANRIQAVKKEVRVDLCPQGF